MRRAGPPAHRQRRRMHRDWVRTVVRARRRRPRGRRRPAGRRHGRLHLEAAAPRPRPLARHDRATDEGSWSAPCCRTHDRRREETLTWPTSCSSPGTAAATCRPPSASPRSSRPGATGSASSATRGRLRPSPSGVWSSRASRPRDRSTRPSPATPLKVLATFGDRAWVPTSSLSSQERPADVVVVDCLLFGVMDALRAAGRSYVALEHSFDTCWRRTGEGPLRAHAPAARDEGARTARRRRAQMACHHPDLDAGHGDVVHTGTGREPVAPRRRRGRPSWSA